MSIPQSLNGPFKPILVIHGGAGNLTKRSIPKELYDQYITSMDNILRWSFSTLYRPSISALDVAVHAVTLLEDDALYNSGKGAVFTREGHNELEASVMVSGGYRKRCVGVQMLRRVRNPIRLAREILVRGEEEDGEEGDHCVYSGDYAEWLAAKWGLQMVGTDYFFTQKRWDEHIRGLASINAKGSGLSDWEKDNYIPLGTCGAVVMDTFGNIAVATSTGGLTNKVAGRVGDTPTPGAGFWAEEWMEDARREMVYQSVGSPMDMLSRGDLRRLVNDCIPGFGSHDTTPSPSTQVPTEKASQICHAVALSGTGNGDSFLRTSAARTTAAYSRFSHHSLDKATSWMAGPGGELQKSAGDRWGKSHEGTGGMIGIEMVGGKASIIADYNCGGMFRGWIDQGWKRTCLVFREENWESGPEGWDSVYGSRC